MDLDVVWNLPATYGNPKVVSQLSADAQIYRQCVHCGNEARIDVSLATAMSFDESKCPACHEVGMALIRHLEKRTYRCEDCFSSLSIFTARYLTDRCEICGSSRLALLSSSVEPPYPPRFHELLVAKDNEWGISAREDIEYIVQSTQAMNMLPDFPLFLLADILFAERLRFTGGYEDEDDVSHLLNLEGNLYRDYFRRTGEMWAGVRAIPIFEQCVREESNPVNRALMEHNVSMAIYSLLSQNEESLVELASGRNNIRRLGIESAQRALEVFDSEAPGTYLPPESIRGQRARIHHLLGDILKVGDATETERINAIGHFDKALSLNALDSRLTAGVRISRATTICRLDNPGRDLTTQAIRDFEFAISQKEVGRAWSEKMEAFGNLSLLYQRQNDLIKATQYSEQAVAIALHEINMVVEEQILKQKTSQYSRAFEQLVALYATRHYSEKALAVSEAYRAGTVRVHTMSPKEKASYQRTAAEKAVRAGYKQLLGGSEAALEIAPLNLKSVLPRIDPLRKYLRDKNMALVSLNISQGFTTVLILGRKKLFGNGLATLQWRIDPSFVKDVERYIDLDPSPFREYRLRQICDICWRALLEPMQSYFREHGITTVGLVAPSLIGQVPFEGFERPDSDEPNITKAVNFFYLPSLRVGSDLVSHVQGLRARKLLIVGYADDDLPFTIQEVETLKALFKSRVVVLDTRGMSKLEVTKRIQEPYDYVHFTCHGSFNPAVPLDSALHLVRDPQNDNQRITARDLLGMKFPNTPIVTMSACSTALVGLDSSNGYAGLIGSLLQGGARCVIGSRWPVYDDTASIFMTSLYARLVSATDSPFDCFVATQHDRTKLKALEDWAAFAYVGLP